MKKTFTKLFYTLALLFLTTTMWAQNITFMVDMTNYINGGGVISANGVHITGNFTVPNWDPTTAIYAFTQVGTTNVYELTISTVDVAQFMAPATDPDYKFKFINSQQANFSWGECHVDQECLPSGDVCTDGGDNRSLGAVGTLPTSDAYYSATWDSCTGTIFTLTGVNEINGAIASITAFPNPAVSDVTISFVLGKSAKMVTLSVYNAIGQVAQQISRTNQKAGVNNYNININSLSNGVYFYSINVDGIVATHKLVVSK